MNFDEYLYIDYENVQDINVDVIKKSTKIIIIVGNSQTKIPIELIQKTQKLGESVEWIRVDGKGKNALDFFITFFLGKSIALDKSKKFIIYSKDTGYDPLVNYLKKNKINVIRIESFKELSKNNNVKLDENILEKVKENLIKTASNNRPKKRKSLTGFVTGRLKNGEDCLC